jgi:hypothetical protein
VPKNVGAKENSTQRDSVLRSPRESVPKSVDAKENSTQRDSGPRHESSKVRRRFEAIVRRTSSADVPRCNGPSEPWIIDAVALRSFGSIRLRDHGAKGPGANPKRWALRGDRIYPGQGRGGLNRSRPDLPGSPRPTAMASGKPVHIPVVARFVTRRCMRHTCGARLAQSARRPSDARDKSIIIRVRAGHVLVKAVAGLDSQEDDRHEDAADQDHPPNGAGHGARACVEMDGAP